MAGITVNAVVHIAPDVRVIKVGCIVVPMAARALERGVGRRGARMAIRTDTARIAVVCGEVGVSKSRSQPIRRGVARRAGGWDDSDDGGVGRQVIRYSPAQGSGAIPIGGVATVAVGRRRRTTGMAQVAGHREMRACEWESSRAMVKGSA